MSRFPELLRRLFSYYGFEAAPPEKGGIRLRKGSLAVVIVMVEDSAETDEKALEMLLAAETAADRVIVASLGRFTEKARMEAIKRKVQLWDRAHLEEEVGRMVMGEVDTRQAAPVADGLLEPFLKGDMTELGPAEPQNPLEPPHPGQVEAEDAHGGPQARKGEGLSGAGPEIPGGEAMVRPQITLEQVRGLVKNRLQNAFRLEGRDPAVLLHTHLHDRIHGISLPVTGQHLVIVEHDLHGPVRYLGQFYRGKIHIKGVMLA